MSLDPWINISIWHLTYVPFEHRHENKSCSSIAIFTVFAVFCHFHRFHSFEFLVPSFCLTFRHFLQLHIAHFFCLFWQEPPLSLVALNSTDHPNPEYQVCNICNLFLTFWMIWGSWKWSQMISHAQEQGVDIKIKSIVCSEPKLQLHSLKLSLASYSPSTLFLTFRCIWGSYKWSQMILHPPKHWAQPQNQVSSMFN